jgi:hypothetical protein
MTRPLAGSPDELVWLRGYEAAVIEMRKEFDNIRADERARVVEECAQIVERGVYKSNFPHDPRTMESGAAAIRAALGVEL